MPELMTAWVTLAVSADGMQRDIRRELNKIDGNREFSRLGKQLETAVGNSAKTAATEVRGTLGERLGTKVGTAVGNAVAIGVIRPLSPAIRGIARMMGVAGDESGREFNRRFDAATRRTHTPSAAEVLGGVAGVAGPAATAILGVGSAYQVLSSGFDRLKSIDDAKFKLKALGHDTKSTAKIMDSALAAVKGTAFGMDEAATAASTAVAAGIKPGEELTKYLTTIGDAAAVGGTSLADMGHIFNKVQTSGKAMTDDLNMLGDRGLPIFPWLQKEFGVTGAELSKMVEQGKIDAATFNRVIQQNIGGAAQKMGTSFSGSMENVGAAVSRLGAAFLEPFFGKSGDALGKITEMADKATGFVKEHQPELVQFAAAVAGGFTEMAAAATRAFAGILRGFARVIEAMQPMVGQIGGFFKTVGGFELFGQKFSPQIEDAGKWLQDFDGKMGNAVDTLNTAAQNVDGVKDKIYRSSDGIKDLGERTAEALRFTKDFGTSLSLLPDKKTIVLDDNTPEVIDKIDQTQYKIEHLPDGQVKIVPLTDEATRKADAWRAEQNGTPATVPVKADTSQATTALNKLFGDFSTLNISPVVSPAPAGAPFIGSGQSPAARLFGAIVPMADGGYRWITKPSSADIYQGRGAGTVFAEQETGGEAYIPLAPSKRSRSLQILMEVARLFGLNSNAEGSITVDELKSYASGISGGSYVRGGPAGLTGTDCSGGQSALANFITGASGRFATGNEAQALLARGFQQGDPPAGVAAYWIGWKNGGPGGGHTAGTILDPDGGNVNVEMGGKSGGGQYGGSAAGASEFPNRAWIALAGYGEDLNAAGGGGGSSARVMSAQASVRRTKAATAAAQKDLDDANAEISSAPDEKKRKAAEKKRDAAQRRLDSATDRQAVAEQKLSEVKDKEAAKADKAASGDGGAQGFGQSLVSGLFQGLGLDGSVFSNFLDWPNVKSALALVNWGGGLLASLNNPEGRDGGSGGAVGGAFDGVGLPNITDFLKPIPPGSTTPIARPDEMHAGSGAAPGPTYDFRGAQLGVSPTEFTQKVDARQNSAWRRNTGAHK